MSERTFEERLRQLEREVVRLKARKSPITQSGNWVHDLMGTAADDPDYAEIVRLGKEIRDAEEPPEEES